MGNKRAAVDVDAVEKRADAATEGPWEATDYRMVETANVIGDEDDADRADVCEVIHYGAPGGGPFNHGTARFIAASRVDVPALCAALREQDAELAEMRRQRDLLGQAIADAARKAGIYNGEVPLSGPGLLQLAGEIAETVVRQRSDANLRWNVLAFHAVMDMRYPEAPGVPSADVVRFRARLITEEYFETMRALFALNPVEGQMFARAERDTLESIESFTPGVDLPEFADGLADLMYVSEGSFLAFGLDSGPIHAEVQRSNMAKAGGPIREDGKRLKPPGWVPPDIAGEIEKQLAASQPEVNL